MYSVSFQNWLDNNPDDSKIVSRIGNDLVLLRYENGAVFQDIGIVKADAVTCIMYTEGSTKIKVNMRTYDIVAPSLFIMMPGQIYEPLECSGDVECGIIIMSEGFTLSLLLGSALNISLQKRMSEHPVINMLPEAFDRYFNMLADINRSGSPYKVETARYLTLAFFYGYTCGVHEVEDDTEKGNASRICDSFLTALQRNYKEHKDLEFYAEELCLSSKYLSSIVKQETGRTAGQYIKDYVIMDSKAMLASTTMSVREISDTLNFPSQSVFGKYFKNATGVSPLAFRKQNSLKRR